MVKWKYKGTLTVQINKHPPGTTVLIEDDPSPTRTICLPDGVLSWAFENEVENIECLFSQATPTKSA